MQIQLLLFMKKLFHRKNVKKWMKEVAENF